MKRMYKKRWMLMFVLAVLLLIPMTAVTAQASPKVWYEFNFSYGNNSITGTKTDFGYAAGVSVWEGSEFNNGNVRFQLFSPNGSPYSYESDRVYGITSTCPVYYFSYLSFNGNMSVKMEGHGYNGTTSCKGNFVP